MSGLLRFLAVSCVLVVVISEPINQESKAGFPVSQERKIRETQNVVLKPSHRGPQGRRRHGAKTNNLDKRMKAKKGRQSGKCRKGAKCAKGRRPKKAGGRKRKASQKDVRVTTGVHCDFISYDGLAQDGIECSKGTKFVVKATSEVRKQFLIMDGVAIIAFVGKGKKFADCDAFNDITSAVQCKVVDGLDPSILKNSNGTVSGQ